MTVEPKGAPKKSRRSRRPGATETFSVSVDRKTKLRLKTLARARHGGNVSALITELALEGERHAAFERAWQWYGGPEPTADELAALRAEWEGGWKLARKARAKRSKRRTAA
ncbi:MAG: hypothetical protein KF819_17505 [Labilithrix sp.]|nr:hypothetical protein [Labilithrix sp.]